MGGLLGIFKEKEEDVMTAPTSKLSTWNINPYYEQSEITSYVATAPWDRKSISRLEYNPYLTLNYSSRYDGNSRYKNQDMNSSLRYSSLTRESDGHCRKVLHYARTSEKYHNSDSSSSSDSYDYYPRETIRRKSRPTASNRINLEHSSYSTIQEKVKYSTYSSQPYWNTFNDYKSPKNVMKPKIPIAVSKSTQIDYDTEKNRHKPQECKSNEATFISPRQKQNAAHNNRKITNETKSAENILRSSVNSEVNITVPRLYQDVGNSERNHNLESFYDIIGKKKYCALKSPTPYQSSSNSYCKTLKDSRPAENISDRSSYSSNTNYMQNILDAATCSYRTNLEKLHEINPPEFKFGSTDCPILNSTVSPSSADEWDATKYVSRQPNSITLNTATNLDSQNLVSESDLSSTSPDVWDASQYVTHTDESISNTSTESKQKNIFKCDENSDKYSFSLNSTKSDLCDENYSTFMSQSNLPTSNMPTKIENAHKKSIFSKNDLDGRDNKTKHLKSNFRPSVNCEKTAYQKSSKSLNTYSDINDSHPIQSPLSYFKAVSNSSIATINLNIKNKKLKSPVSRGMNRTKKISEGIVKKCLPSNWNCRKQSPMPEIEIVDLQEDHSEFIDLKQQIANTLKVRQVWKIARIENPYQYCMYLLKQSELNFSGGKKCMEIRQFHGTKNKYAPSIIMDNFDWRLHGTNVGQRTGQGVSFSRLASFASFYAKDVLFVVRVLVTDFSLGDSNTVLPTNGADTTTRKDGKVIVKFDDCTFYPEYVVILSPSSLK